MKKLVLAAALCAAAALSLVTTATTASAGGFASGLAQSVSNQSNPVTGVLAGGVFVAKAVLMSTAGNVLSFAATGKPIKGVMAPLKR